MTAMTDAELSEIGLRHFDDEAQVHGKTHCEGCGQSWPCDTAVALAEVERLRGVVENLAARKPLRQRRFSNMGSPDSVTECIFCGADDYNGLPISHKDSCVWAAALADLEGKP